MTTDHLSRRLRQTLACLLDGNTEKRAAQRLGISGSTLHQYVTMLYRHFGVTTRSALLVYCLPRRGLDSFSERDLSWRRRGFRFGREQCPGFHSGNRRVGYEVPPSTSFSCNLSVRAGALEVEGKP